MTKPSKGITASLNIGAFDTKKHDDKERWEYSVFRIIANTNRAGPTKHKRRELATNLKDFAEYLSQNLGKYMIQGSFDVKERKALVDKKLPVPEEWIKSAKYEVNLEEGSKLHRLHSDGFLTVVHRGAVWLDQYAIMAKAKDFEVCMVNIRGVRDVARYIAQYSRKEQERLEGSRGKEERERAYRRRKS